MRDAIGLGMLDLAPPLLDRGCSVRGLTSRWDTAAAAPVAELPLLRPAGPGPPRCGVGAERTACPRSAALAARLSSGVTSGFSAVPKLLAAFAAASSARRERSVCSGDGPLLAVPARLRGVIWRLAGPRAEGMPPLSAAQVRALAGAKAALKDPLSSPSGRERLCGAATSVVMHDEYAEAAVSRRVEADDDGGRGAVGMHTLPAVLGGSCTQPAARTLAACGILPYVVLTKWRGPSVSAGAVAGHAGSDDDLRHGPHNIFRGGALHDGHATGLARIVRHKTSRRCSTQRVQR